jgi:hypothetical protein
MKIIFTVEVEAEDIKAVYDELKDYKPNHNVSLLETKRWAINRFMNELNEKINTKVKEETNKIDNNLRQMLGMEEINYRL